jgi:hypothetical protein
MVASVGGRVPADFFVKEVKVFSKHYCPICEKALPFGRFIVFARLSFW